MDYLIKIDEFEGPLDLLLHLIKTSEIEIYDISISEVTIQYINYIKAMEQLNLEIASEYLVMAADLIRIKSMMLLPKPVMVDEYVEEVDPREELIEKLVLYKKYKQASEVLDDFKIEREQVFTKVFNDEYEVECKYILDSNLEVFDLLKALKKMQKRIDSQVPMTTVIEKHEITVEARMITLCEHVYLHEKVNFSDLFIEYNRSYLVTTFLAVLELVKEGKIYLDNIVEDDFTICKKEVDNIE